jgi:hypothetical protein
METGDLITKYKNGSDYLAILPECNAPERCAQWLGAINGNTHIGCAINVLKFMGEIDETQSAIAVQQAEAQGGTPFNQIVQWFNNKSGFTEDGDKYFKETSMLITRPRALTAYFNLLIDKMPDNSCAIVRLTRNENETKRPRYPPLPNDSSIKYLTFGHYVLMSKEADDKLWTYDPLMSTTEKCHKRQFIGITDKLWEAYYDTQKYETVSLLTLHDKTIQSGGGSEDLIKGVYKIDNSLFNNFTKSIEDAVECGVGGKRRRKSTLKKWSKKTLATSRKKKRKKTLKKRKR